MLASLTTLIAAIGILTPYQEPTIGAVDGFLDRATLFPDQLQSVRVRPVEHDDSVPLPDRKQPGKGLPFQSEGDPNFLGCSTGRYYPPADELLDPQLGMPLLSLDQRPEDYTYGFIMFSKRITREREEILRELGCRVLDFHPHYCLQVAMPRERLTELSTLPFVRWVGTLQPWQKMHPALRNQLEQFEGGRIDLVVNLFESDLCEDSIVENDGPGWVRQGQEGTGRGSDSGPRVWKSNGWQQRALEALGFEVRRYGRTTHSIHGTIDPRRVSDLAGLDFVQFLEAVSALKVFSRPDEESTPMIGLDYVRGTYDGSWNKAAIVGMADTGMERDHQDFGGLSFLSSDCTAAGDAWEDTVNHGTHVAGIMLGQGVAASDLLGNQPGLGSWGASAPFYNLRIIGNLILDPLGNTIPLPNGGFMRQQCSMDTGQIMDMFGQGAGATPRPHVINNSWGSDFTDLTVVPIGNEEICRDIDNAIYGYGQLHIFAMGNRGPGWSTLSIQAASKNALSVGSVLDHIDAGGNSAGSVSTFSSRGPCADGRWKPNVCAPGEGILSMDATNNAGYLNQDGTSMATPHVTALAASLVDRFDSMRYDPALLSAVIMASAIPRNLGAPPLLPGIYPMLHPGGVGCVNAIQAHGDSPASVFTRSSFIQVDGLICDGTFEVPDDTSRLVVVMHYIEPGCSSTSEAALTNDYDLWLDEAPFGSSGNSGEHFVHQSSVDNTEIAVIDNPNSGLWRWKTNPRKATSSTVMMAVVVHIIKDDPEPNASITLDADKTFVKKNEDVRVDATVAVDGYIGASVVLDRSGHLGVASEAGSVLYDGLVTDVTDNPTQGRDITLGDILVGKPRSAGWKLSYGTEGIKTVTVQVLSGNMPVVTESVQVVVDETPPALPQSLVSTTHPTGQWSTSGSIDFSWQAAVDNVSGLDGYCALMTDGSPQLPPEVMFLGDVTSFSPGGLLSSKQPQFFTLRPVDKGGNWSPSFATAGPFFIDKDAPDAPVFQSSSHTPGVPSCDPTVYVTWSKVVDDHSGTKGYGLYWTKNPNSIPGETLGSVANFTTSNTLSPGSWYLHVRTKDIAGNWTAAADTAHLGPFVIEQCPLFEDDFESGSLFTNGWIQVNSRVRPSTSAAFTGNYGVRLRKTQTIEQDISTLGMQNVMLTLDRRAMSYEKGDPGFRISWSSGLKWKTLYSTTIDSWGTVYLYLPPEAWDSPNLRIRFQSLGNSWFDYTEIDNVRVLATSK